MPTLTSSITFLRLLCAATSRVLIPTAADPAQLILDIILCEANNDLVKIRCAGTVVTRSEGALVEGILLWKVSAFDGFSGLGLSSSRLRTIEISPSNCALILQMSLVSGIDAVALDATPF